MIFIALLAGAFWFFLIMSAGSFARALVISIVGTLEKFYGKRPPNQGP